MPTQTFYNLEKEKRQRLTRVAIEEFKQSPLNQASVANIVKAGEISRGSFYQYFDNLEDCYGYVLSIYEEKISDYILSQGPAQASFIESVQGFARAYIQVCMDSDDRSFLEKVYLSVQPHLKQKFLYHIMKRWMALSESGGMEDFYQQSVIQNATEQKRFLKCLINGLNYTIVEGYQKNWSSETIFENFSTEFQWMLQGVIKSKQKEGI